MFFKLLIFILFAVICLFVLIKTIFKYLNENLDDKDSKIYFNGISYNEWKSNAVNYYKDKNDIRASSAFCELIDNNLVITLYDGKDVLDRYVVDSNTHVIKNKKGKKVVFDN